MTDIDAIRARHLLAEGDGWTFRADDAGRAHRDRATLLQALAERDEEVARLRKIVTGVLITYDLDTVQRCAGVVDEIVRMAEHAESDLDTDYIAVAVLREAAYPALDVQDSDDGWILIAAALGDKP